MTLGSFLFHTTSEITFEIMATKRARDDAVATKSPSKRVKTTCDVPDLILLKNSSSVTGSFVLKHPTLREYSVLKSLQATGYEDSASYTLLEDGRVLYTKNEKLENASFFMPVRNIWEFLIDLTEVKQSCELNMKKMDTFLKECYDDDDKRSIVTLLGGQDSVQSLAARLEEIDLLDLPTLLKEVQEEKETAAAGTAAAQTAARASREVWLHPLFMFME